MEKIGLVLQGGGMRGVYTSGALDFFMEKGLYFPYVAAVSAGACNASAYLSRQKGLGKIMHINYLKDPRYISLKNLWYKKSIFGMDFIFDELPKKLQPFHYDIFHQAKEKLVVGTTDCSTGKSLYFEKDSCEQIFTVIRASCSLPFISPIVDYQGFKLLDGGITDPIPIKKSLFDGNEVNVIVLTCDQTYKEKQLKLKWMAKKMYPYYKDLVHAIYNHYKVYNETIEYIKQLEAERKAFVLRPQKRIKVKRIEKNPHKLTILYEQGYADAKESYFNLKNWMPSSLV
jgi:predicted patatin/cPLA2 family phospholipase